MSAGWPCPRCGASCRNTVTLQIHLKHCRALSVEEIEAIILKVQAPLGEVVFSITSDGQRAFLAEKIHEAQIARLRGRKGA